MSTVSKLLVLLLCLEHLYILYLEMFCWTHPKTVRALGLTEESARQSKFWRPIRVYITAFCPRVWPVCWNPPASPNQSLYSLLFVFSSLVSTVVSQLTSPSSISKLCLLWLL